MHLILGSLQSVSWGCPWVHNRRTTIHIVVFKSFHAEKVKKPKQPSHLVIEFTTSAASCDMTHCRAGKPEWRRVKVLWPSHQVKCCTVGAAPRLLLLICWRPGAGRLVSHHKRAVQPDTGEGTGIVDLGEGEQTQGCDSQLKACVRVPNNSCRFCEEATTPQGLSLQALMCL